jgi:hypothetical protein
MSSRSGAAVVSLNGTVGVTNPRSTGVALAPGFVRRTVMDCHQPVRKGEPADRRDVCSVDAVTEVVGGIFAPAKKGG